MRFRPASIRPSALSAALTALTLTLLVAATERYDADLGPWSWPVVALVTLAVSLLLEQTLFRRLERGATPSRITEPGPLGWTIALVPPLILAACAAWTVSAEAPHFDYLIPAGAIWLGSMTSLALSRNSVRRE